MSNFKIIDALESGQISRRQERHISKKKTTKKQTNSNSYLLVTQSVQSI